MAEAHKEAATPRQLGTTEARTKLPALVRELAGRKRAAASLTEAAYEIGQRQGGGAWLVAEVDAKAAIKREEKLRREVAELEEEIENIALAIFLEDRIKSGGDERIPAKQFLSDLGFDDLAAKV